MSDRAAILDTLKQKVIENYSENRAGSMRELKTPGFVPTKSLCLHYLIGRPGIPVGRLSEIRGWSGSGKSMICTHILGGATEAGGFGVVLDTEHSYTPDWVENLGTDPDEVLRLHPPTLEGAFDMIFATIDELAGIDSDAPKIIVVDSLSALQTESEQEDGGGPLMGHAKYMSQAMRRVTDLLWEKKVGMVVVSQLRDDPMSFGGGTSTLGGHAVTFHAALILQLQRSSLMTDSNKQAYGMKVKAKSVKNKLGGVPFGQIEFPLYYDRGIDRAMDAFYLGQLLGVIESNRGWYNLKGDDNKFREKEWPEVMTDEVYERIKEKAFS